MIVGLIWTFFYCYYATQTTDLMIEISDVVYHAYWYTYPRNIIQLIWGNTYYSFYLEHKNRIFALDSKSCSLRTFKQVLSSNRWKTIILSIKLNILLRFSLLRLADYKYSCIVFFDVPKLCHSLKPNANYL